MNPSHPTWIEIDLSAVAHNCARIVQDTSTPLMAIVKGDAYGHGAVEVGRAAVAGGASWLGVARCCEARALREAGIQAPILVLGMVTPEEVDEAISQRLTLTLHDPETLALFSARARAAHRTLGVHLKVETGLGRVGVFPEEVPAFARKATAGGSLVLDGMYSHLAVADEDHPLNELQAKRFRTVVQAMESEGMRPRWVHLANSAAAYWLPETRYDLVRVGNVVLGMRISIDRPLPEAYRPVLSWKARLGSCRVLPEGWGVGYGQTYVTERDELIGVIPVGYGDGLRRVPGNQVLIGGERCPVVGRSCLDQSMVRLPRPFPVGEEVVVVGSQGGEAIWFHDLAALYKTTQVDISTHLHSRVPHIYKHG